jgi:YrbI family 3-deoxy-D-manno-octulosonate 8-phosphate phosphatase
MVIAFVPVRGGSKSIPLKNIKDFCGRPLIYWNLKALTDAKEVDQIVVATDSGDIEQIVKGFEFEKVVIYSRLAQNAEDTASTESVILEYIESSEISSKDSDTFILSQVTNPFTTAADFSQALIRYRQPGIDSLLSCAPIKRFFWNVDGTAQNYDYKNRPRRQDFKGTLIENGAFYINSVGNIKKFRNRLSGKISIYEMPDFTQLEIDEPHDWVIAEVLFKETVYETFLPNIADKIKKIKIVLSDVDGVLTDSGMYYSESGDELKKFNTRDGMGFELLRNAGFKTAIVTSEVTEIVTKRAAKLKLDFVYQGKRDGGKLDAIKEICIKENLNLDEVAYIGDDINCIAALNAVGLAACPADASLLVKNIPGITVLKQNGGEGVFREFAELVLLK